MDFTAHIRESDGMEQSVTEHCRNVAALAESYGESVGLGKLARLQGIFHDAGKLNRDFYAYIHGDSRFHRGEIDHCYAGAKYLCAFSDRHFPEQEMPYRTSRLIARTILSHHGLHDWLTESGDDYFRIRTAKVERYEEIEPNLDAMLAEMGYSEASLKALLEDASEEFAAVYRRIKELRSENRKAFDAGNKAEKQNRRTEFTFYLGMLERLLQSILMDADCVDTADFMNDCQTEKHYDSLQVWERMELAMQRKLDGFSGGTDAISRQRQDISRRCAEFAAHPVGICRLIVPTGGGKTLSSLRFAIRYAMRPENGIEKIVYTAPFMSILEQNSQDFRDISFGCVVRSKAGLSNAAQAAGRCNRHGEMRKICPVYLMKLTEENIDRLKEIVSAQNVTSAVWDSLCMQQKEKETDLLSVETLSQYFQKLYQENQKELSFPQSENDQDLLKLLSTDSKRAELGKGNRSKYDKFSLQAFATAGKAFHVIEDAGESVIVPYDEDAGQMIRDLNGDLEFGQMQKLLRSVQKYTVSVYAGDKRKLAEAGALCPLHCGALALEENFYDKTALGLLTEGQERPFLDL